MLVILRKQHKVRADVLGLLLFLDEVLPREVSLTFLLSCESVLLLLKMLILPLIIAELIDVLLLLPLRKDAVVIAIGVVAFVVDYCV